MKAKKYGLGFLAAVTMLVTAGHTAAEPPVLPKEIYEWVQSTARAGYYFNRQQMGYAVRKDGTIDLNILIVPTVKLYDQVQIDDVVAKRRWRMQDCRGYDDLVGAADYLRFDLAAGTVEVTEHDDLDSKLATLSMETTGKPVSLEKFSSKDVDGKFYRAILDYAAQNRRMLINRSWGKLTPEDKERLAAEETQAAEKE
ncbi:MAG: hypothetical protein IJ849_06800 [Selenomonadaceae bacterium]|nr:hypothetical protein [Selenomonadaceae bacterium]